MDLHLSKCNNSRKESTTKPLIQTTIVNQQELEQYDDCCENLCEIQLDEYRENNLAKRKYAIHHKNDDNNDDGCQTSAHHLERRMSDDKNAVECLSIKFQSDIWPINAIEQRENFFKHGLSPKFKLKGSPSGIEKMINHQNGQIKFNYFYEAKRILDLSLRKYKTLDKFVFYAFGRPITLNEGKERVTNYLKANNLENSITVIWSKHLICSAQMCSSKVRGKKRERQYTLLIKGNHENTFIREFGIECLLNHEVGTHYLRSYNDTLQVWNRNRIKYGIIPVKSHEGMKTEEGLACIHTILNAKIKYLCMPALLYYCSCMAEYLSFKQLFEHLSRYVKNPEQRWKHCMRIKRILKSTTDVGGYGKDQRYFEGAVEILRNIDRIDFKTLICGKIIWTDIPKVQKLLKKNSTKMPNFMDDYDKYISTLKEIAYLNGLTAIPEPKFQSKSRKQIMQYLGITEEQLQQSIKNSNGGNVGPLCNGSIKTGPTAAGGDAEKKPVKLCGCSLYTGIRYDIHLDINDNIELRNTNPFGHSMSNSNTNKKRYVPIIFELDMRKPIMQ